MISILIPIYNGIEYLKDSIQSVNQQTFKDWEVIIAINGHLPNSPVYQEALNYKSDKIKIFDLYNSKGKSNTLNEMLKLASYNWIALLDVDDIWHKKKLEMQMRYINDYDVIGTRCKYFGDSKDVPKIPVRDFSNYNFLNSNPIINSSSLIKKELCNWDYYFDSVEDYDLWLRLRRDNKRFYNLKEILTYHRVHKNSFFNTDNKQQKLVEELKQKYK